LIARTFTVTEPRAPARLTHPEIAMSYGHVLVRLNAEEFAFLIERTATHPTLVSRLQALEHLRAAGIPVPARTLTAEVMQAFAEFELLTARDRKVH
jgi:hypothetical protein